MIAGRFAFQGLSEYLTWQKIKRLEYTFPEGFDDQARDLVEKLLVIPLIRLLDTTVNPCFQVRNPAERLGVGSPGTANDIQALRNHPFFASVGWKSLWVDPAPPIEAGLVRREHPLLGTGHDQNWDDVGAAWDDLVASEEEGDDDVEWASDAEGPAYQMRPNRISTDLRPEDSVEIGPMGEVRRRDPPSPVLIASILQDTATIIGSTPVTDIPVEAHKAPTMLQDSPVSGSPSSSSEGSPFERLRSAMGSMKLNSTERSLSDVQHSGPQSTRERGRTQMTTPVQGNVDL